MESEISFNTCDLISIISFLHLGSNSYKSYDLVVIGGGSGGLACAKEGKTSYKQPRNSPQGWVPHSYAVFSFAIPKLLRLTWKCTFVTFKQWLALKMRVHCGISVVVLLY